jgi:hypothetical protein
LSEKILFGEVAPGEIVIVDVEAFDADDKAKFTFLGLNRSRRSSCPTLSLRGWARSKPAGRYSMCGDQRRASTANNAVIVPLVAERLRQAPPLHRQTQDHRRVLPLPRRRPHRIRRKAAMRLSNLRHARLASW